MLERQPQNEHDANAIAVKIRGAVAGHLDRESARLVAPVFDIAMKCKVGELLVEKHGATSVPLNIWLTYEPAMSSIPTVVAGRVAGIYEVKVQSRSERYVGQARDINRRLKQHWEELAMGNHPNPLLRELWHQFGGGAFESAVVELAPDDLSELALGRWLYERECFWIGVY